MKPEIHPEYEVTNVVCVCGEVFQIRSTKQEIKVGVCSKCHPFYTGKAKHIDTEGRVERFKKKYGERYKKGKKEAAPVAKATSPQEQTKVVTPPKEEAKATPPKAEAKATPPKEEAKATPPKEEAKATPPKAEAKATPKEKAKEPSKEK